MNKPSGWSALLFGLLLAGMSGISMADRGHGGGGHGGHGGHDGHGGHVRAGVGIVFNPFGYAPWPYYYPPYYYPPYYYPPTVVTSPPVYIEHDEGAPPTSRASAYWYYCSKPQGYYPYVTQCPGGWQAVAPQPPGLPDEER